MTDIKRLDCITDWEFSNIYTAGGYGVPYTTVAVRDFDTGTVVGSRHLFVRVL